MFDPMNRRLFLKRTGQAVAAAAVGRAAFAGAQTSTDATCDKDICKAIKFHHVAGDMSVEDKFKLLKDVGFDGTEYRRRDDIDTKTLIRASEKTDLPIHGVINSSDSDLAGAIDLARELGATSVLYVAGRVNGETSYDENYRQTQEVIRKAIPHAEKREIPILIENVWNNFLLSPMEMARYIDELESDYVGAYFDTGNVVRFGWPEQWIRILGQRIGKLDIKEYSRDIQREQGLYKGFDVPLGEGSVDWPAVREALEQIGCTGWATKERGSGGRDYLAEVSRRMNKILALER